MNFNEVNAIVSPLLCGFIIAHTRELISAFRTKSADGDDELRSKGTLESVGRSFFILIYT